MQIIVEYFVTKKNTFTQTLVQNETKAKREVNSGHSIPRCSETQGNDSIAWRYFWSKTSEHCTGTQMPMKDITT